MPPFYFDYDTGRRCASHDDVGTELTDIEAAKLEAAMATGEWIKDNPSGAGTELVISVRNGEPTPVFVVRATIKIS
jgi:hypothetical protein